MVGLSVKWQTVPEVFAVAHVPGGGMADNLSSVCRFGQHRFLPETLRKGFQSQTGEKFLRGPENWCCVVALCQELIMNYELIMNWLWITNWLELIMNWRNAICFPLQIHGYVVDINYGKCYLCFKRGGHLYLGFVFKGLNNTVNVLPILGPHITYRTTKNGPRLIAPGKYNKKIYKLLVKRVVWKERENTFS